MIEQTLVFLKTQLNAYLKLKTGEENKLSLTPLTDNAGKTVLKDLGIVLVNIEEERMLRNQEPFQPSGDGSFIKVNPELNLNLFILVAANFGDKENDYRESLKFLAHVATFFQSRNVFTPANSPQLDSKIKRLVVELVSLSFESQNNLWASFGVSYLPSLLYKIRMVSLQETEIQMEAPPITEANLFD
jgi:hypothetical protein